MIFSGCSDICSQSEKLETGVDYVAVQKIQGGEVSNRLPQFHPQAYFNAVWTYRHQARDRQETRCLFFLWVKRRSVWILRNTAMAACFHERSGRQVAAGFLHLCPVAPKPFSLNEPCLRRMRMSFGACKSDCQLRSANSLAFSSSSSACGAVCVSDRCGGWLAREISHLACRRRDFAVSSNT